MKNYLIVFLFISLLGCGDVTTQNPELQKWESRASNVTIIRDQYGVPHIYGKTDADAVFGMLYAQCEDDFNRVEMNYVNAMGRLAEIEGEDEVWRDLRMKIFINPDEMKQTYESSPAWIKELMDAFADGINYYLHTHPETQPKLITKFEPWMALTFSEGSIGGDIERVSLNRLRDFYGSDTDNSLSMIPNHPWISDNEPRGSNGISLSPQITENGNSLFLINPHTSFFFRSEQHIISEEGLNSYGAVTWGQFFIYQGFNDRLGWMHTSSRADAIDEYLETIIEKEGKYVYLHDGVEKEVIERNISIPYKAGESIESREFKAFYTHHGPIIRSQDNKWVSIALMQRPLDAYIQSYSRTKARNYEEFYKSMEIRTNSSNNTVYADADGNIAYFHGNYVPKRNIEFDWSRPVDGSLAETDYLGLHTVDEMVMIKNPSNGWIQNCNSTPFTVSGSESPNPDNYANYIAPDALNFRDIHAQQVLEGKSGWTMESLKEAAYDSYIPGLAYVIPSLLSDLSDKKSEGNITEAYALLKDWDYRFSAESIETTLATEWGNAMLRESRNHEWNEGNAYDWMAQTADSELRTQVFASVLDNLEKEFGTWKVQWGEMNRYQRTTGDIVQDFSDDKPSLPVGFHSGRWGSLASFGARKYPGTSKMYGTSGNSFVAIVEFGEELKAWSISTGGQSGDATSTHFDDQAEMYTKGEFKEVKFYRKDIEAGAEETYQPGMK